MEVSMAGMFKFGGDDYRVTDQGFLQKKSKGYSDFVNFHHLPTGAKVKGVSQNDGKTLIETTMGFFEMLSGTSFRRKSWK